MNTVLDDNMTLCLANGERVKLNWTMRMLFEVEDLKVASPATVSRCGMVYLTASDLDWRSYVKSWLPTLPEEPFTQKAKDMIYNLFDAYADKGLEFVRKNCFEPVTTQDTQLIIAACNLFTAIFNGNAATAHGCASKDALGETPLAPRQWKDVDPAEFEKLITPGMCWALTWSIGGSVDARSRKALEREIENWFPAVSMPRGGGPFDGYVNFHEGPKFKPWGDLVPSFVFEEGISYFELLVPNPDTVRFAMITDK
jgi:dynein heavy chain